MSAEFIAEEGVLKGVILSLESGEEWSIGRDPEMATLVIEDPKVARKHLVCRLTSDGYVIENFGEENPTLVNGEPISEPFLLEEDDEVTIGETVFLFYPEGAPASYGHEPEFGFEAVEEPPVEEESEEEVAEEEPLEEVEEDIEEEEEEREEIFEEFEEPETAIDLTPTTRFLIKVIAGPNTGAEVALDMERTYLLGTDPATCDVIFNDLSVSREHARLSISSEGEVLIEDLDSRNGVVVDKERITAPQKVAANSVTALGTSAFLLIDREAPSETISAPFFQPPPEEEKEEEEELLEEEELAVAAKERKKSTFSAGTLVLSLIIAGVAVLFGIGMVSLLQSKDIETERQDYVAEIQSIMKEFPSVRFTYNPTSGKLFLMGHVSTGVVMNELLYKLNALLFIRGLENNVVNDEAVWQEMNILLSKLPEFKGVSMHSPEPGMFVLSGYLKSEKQAADLIDYMNVNFNYLNLLQNRVVVDQQIVDEVAAHLIQQGFGAVTVGFTGGELVLTGYVSSTQGYEYESLVEVFEEIPGIRSVKNFVVSVSAEQGVIDLNRRYPGKFRVTGFSKHGDVNVNVVINGRILTRGDQLDDMTVTSIQPHTIFLEKEGLKYKIEYNK